MKKSFRYAACLMALIMVVLCGCGKQTKTDDKKASSVRPTSESSETKIEKKPTLPFGLYVEENGGLKRALVYEAAFPADASDSRWKKDTWTYPGKTNLIWDLVSFQVLPTLDESRAYPKWGNWTNEWNSAGLAGKKIGFEFNITLKDGSKIPFTVTQPKDTFLQEKYFELYLYDDAAHAGSSWYSHTTQNEVTESTMNTSIKITLRSEAYLIDSFDITVFVYSSNDEFDDTGKYTGSEKYTVTVKNTAK